MDEEAIDAGADLKVWIVVSHLALILSVVLAPFLIPAIAIPLLCRSSARQTVWESHAQKGLVHAIAMGAIMIVGSAFTATILGRDAGQDQWPFVVGVIACLLISAIVFLMVRTGRALVMASRGMPA